MVRDNIISIAIGQGEILSTPLQIANMGAMIANRGHYYTPHVVKERKGAALDQYTLPNMSRGSTGNISN